MGIPTSAFEAGDLFIEYGSEEALFRYEKESGRFFRKFYGHSHEDEVPHDNKLLCEATCSGVLTTAERYFGEGAAAAEPADSFSRLAVKHQRTRPYWLSVMHLGDYARSGDIEISADGRLELIKAADSVKELLEGIVSGINSQPRLKVTYGDEKPITVDKKSKEFDFALRLELKERGLSVTGESSYYEGRSGR